MSSRMSRGLVLKFAWFVAGAVAAAPVIAQQPTAHSKRVFTAADYARAEQFMPYKVAPLVFHAGVRPTWLSDDRFWYRNTTPDGTEFVLFDPARGTRGPVFDQAKLAAALSAATGKKYRALHLPFREFDLSGDGHSISFLLKDHRWTCDLPTNQCDDEGALHPNEVLSPDKKRAVFIRDFNLWVRDVATDKESQLTTNGVKDFGYATDNAGWIRSDRPIVLWSADSKKIATFQQDQRGVGEMYLVESKVGHPTLQAWKYPLPGDEVITTIQRVVIEVDAPRVIRLQMPPDQHRSSTCDHVACRGTEFTDAQWSPDATHLAFLSTSRDHKREQLRVADATTGAVRDVLEETVQTEFESGYDFPNWRYLPALDEILWFSERDNWGHLYLYDLQTGKLKNQITTGEGNVAQLLRVDEKNRLLYFLGVGREKGRDPYFFHLYRIGFDGTSLALLTPEDATHEISLSPSGRYFVDSYSKPDVPPVAVLRDSNGRLLSSLE